MASLAAVSLLVLTEEGATGACGRWGVNAGLGEPEEVFGLGVGELDDIFEERIRSDGSGRDGGLPEDLLPPADGVGFRFAVIFASALLLARLGESRGR